MTKEEFDNYLASIGGLISGYNSTIINDAHYFEYGKGWYELTKNLIDELIVLGWDKRIYQAKEKFGTLRWYVDSTPNGGDEVIEKYCDLSRKTCEVCGEEGKLRSGGWLITLCDEHSNERDNK